MKKQTKRIILGCFVVLFGAYTGISYVLLSGMISGSRKPLTMTQPDCSQCHYETVHFTPRGEDFKLEGWFITPKKRESVYTLIFVHGIATNRISNKYTLATAYDFVKKGVKPHP